VTTQDKTKSIRQNKNASLTKNTYNTKATHKKIKPGLVAFYDIQPGNGAGLF